MAAATAHQIDGLVQSYAAKPKDYFANARADFVARLPHDPSASILEIGCGSGGTGALALSVGKCQSYTGVELIEAAATDARGVLSEVIVGNVETLDFDWQPACFDAVILSEVLEHLVDPGRVLKKISRFVRPGGLLMASSPNIAHWRVIRALLGGRFDLADQGVFDRTHLRWFTPATYAALIADAGFRIEEVSPVTPFSRRTARLSRLSGGRLDHLFMTQIAVIATKR